MTRERISINTERSYAEVGGNRHTFDNLEITEDERSVKMMFDVSVNRTVILTLTSEFEASGFRVQPISGAVQKGMKITGGDFDDAKLIGTFRTYFSKALNGEILSHLRDDHELTKPIRLSTAHGGDIHSKELSLNEDITIEDAAAVIYAARSRGIEVSTYNNTINLPCGSKRQALNELAEALAQTPEVRESRGFKLNPPPEGLPRGFVNKEILREIKESAMNALGFRR